MTVGRTIDYEALSQDAMRGVVRTILTEVARNGLPGDHHFYVSFDTQAPGVLISKRLLEKYPEEMTIVLQHRFWDLAVTPEYFEVKLTFHGIPERLVVPFTALRVFFDPSVRYGMQFDIPLEDGGEDGGETGGRAFIGQMSGDKQPASTPQRKPRARKPKIERAATPTIVETTGQATGGAPQTDRPEHGAAVQPLRKPGRPALAPVKGEPGAASTNGKSTAPATDETAGAGEPTKDKPSAAPSGQVVSLDAFRKK